ncbi:xylulokinase [Deinococcus detaillensis]|uniref:xylulokinase n=1 Tax=Deinococcus detaillensis TaxID=2592048 RepID=UPI00163DC9A8|nr:xylulokinase [Deinococcus detaillensis]
MPTGLDVVLGLDLGTSGVKVVALSAAGEVMAQALRPYPLLTPQAGWTEQRPGDWAAATLEALGDVSAQLKGAGHTPLALGLSGQMHGAVFLDAEGDVIRPAPLWNDQRTGAAVAEIEAAIPRAELIARTGNRAVSGFQLPKLLWLRSAEPQNFARVRRVLLPKDYLGFLLTGQARTEPSDASGIGALNLTTKTWDKDVLNALKLDADLFPEVVESWAVVGQLLPEMASATGLPAGLPIIAGGGDNAAAGVALGLSSGRPELGSVSLGTSGVLFAPLAEPTPDPLGRVHSFAHADGGYNLLGVTLSAAGALQWFRDKLAPETPFQTLLDEAAGIQSAEGVTFLPFLSGERSPHMNPDLRASFSGLSLSHGRPQMVRALLEGTAFALADTYDVMRPLSGLTTLLATGGGARSAFWLGLVAGALGLEVQQTAREPGAAEGAAMLAMPAAGLYGSVQAVMTALAPSGQAVAAVDVAEGLSAYQAARQRAVGESI